MTRSIVKDEQCVRFLQWALPQLDMKWSGFRKVRRQVCKRIDRRLRHLGLTQVDAYRDFLEAHDEEWRYLDAMCRITISRFYRDRNVYAVLAGQVLPALAKQACDRGDDELRVWSAGCASGEEPYSLAIAWRLEAAPRFPAVALELFASDADPHMLERARRGIYSAGTLRELPASWRWAFRPQDELFALEEELKSMVTWLCQDLRSEMPDGPFDLVLCRNLAFTYFAVPIQRRILAELTLRLRPGGLLVIGGHESLPAASGLDEIARCIYLKRSLPNSSPACSRES